MKKVLFILLILSFSCTNKKNIFNIEGYWKIVQVEKDGQIIKGYRVSNAIDYFKIRADSSGFRKKITSLDNKTFFTSKHTSSFNIKSKNNQLLIEYKNKSYNSNEIINKISKNELITTNTEKLTFKYKRLENIDLIDE